jgi:L-seryl-tRNA(Ser) seleniumtransferase
VETRQVSLSQLPSIDRLLRSSAVQPLLAAHDRGLVIRALRSSLESVRSQWSTGNPIPAEVVLVELASQRISDWLRPTLQSVVNATGVVLHTNLGRAPLSQSAQLAVERAAMGYTTLEYDLQTGGRGERSRHAEPVLCQLTGAEAALVVNNNAAAVLLALAGLARGKAVLVSRSQLIEIGGGFRIPEILQQSGARLVEVGTTNRTHARDFEQAVSPTTALILHAHLSNFKLVGFAAEPSLADLVRVGGKHSVPVLDDLGSGALLDTAMYGLGHEPTVQESLQAGADLVAFSGDKLLGGPQAGILLGRADRIERLRRNPLARAFRPDKLCLAALHATLLHYLQNEAPLHVPVWQMIAASSDALRQRAEVWTQALGYGEIIPGRSTVGGGSLPEETQPTFLLALSLARPDAAAAWLRAQQPPIITRIQEGRLVLDPRTVLPSQEDDLLRLLRSIPTHITTGR